MCAWQVVYQKPLEYCTACRAGQQDALSMMLGHTHRPGAAGGAELASLAATTLWSSSRSPGAVPASLPVCPPRDSVNVLACLTCNMSLPLVLLHRKRAHPTDDSAESVEQAPLMPTFVSLVAGYTIGCHDGHKPKRYFLPVHLNGSRLQHIKQALASEHTGFRSARGEVAAQLHHPERCSAAQRASAHTPHWTLMRQSPGDVSPAHCAQDCPNALLTQHHASQQPAPIPSAPPLLAHHLHTLYSM